MLKATREAKQKTSWISPSEPYENALQQFIEAIVDPGHAFLADFEPFARRVAQSGVVNSLAQTLLKLASPGIPDIYQGCELFDFSLVDPDNRRSVDFATRAAVLSFLRERMETRDPELARDLLADPWSGALKMFTVAVALEQRRRHPGLFTRGDYLPLASVGERREHACAFARQLREHVVIAVAPRLSVRLSGELGVLPLGAVWGDARIELPTELATGHYRQLYTRQLVQVRRDRGMATLAVADVLRDFPVALLEVA
jgi:(1->4)-alpha-D-glucan 1-alpha-D-glucosylmutase